MRNPQKVLSAGFLLATLALVACSPASTSTDLHTPETMPRDSISSDAPSSDAVSSAGAAMEASSASSQSSAAAVVPPSAVDTSKPRIITMTVQNWEFSPKAIIVKKGEKVIVRLTDADGVHSFVSQELGLDVSLQEGETKDIEIPTGTAGTFSFRCGIPCGPGHRDMTGTIVVS